jgi:alpha-tubulin suppressor-like RCC1 family protein
MISGGGSHCAAVSQEGRVVCWGENGTHRQCEVPLELESERVIAVSCGFDHTAALTAEGKVVCWGCNDLG